jgi:hypothetical protein
LKIDVSAGERTGNAPRLPPFFAAATFQVPRGRDPCAPPPRLLPHHPRRPTPTGGAPVSYPPYSEHTGGGKHTDGQPRRDPASTSLAQREDRT